MARSKQMPVMRGRLIAVTVEIIFRLAKNARSFKNRLSRFLLISTFDLLESLVDWHVNAGSSWCRSCGAANRGGLNFVAGNKALTSTGNPSLGNALFQASRTIVWASLNDFGGNDGTALSLAFFSGEAPVLLD